MDADRISEFRERGSVFKLMAEMKKKIQLVEGERKAVFEDCESEKADNKDKIKKLKSEVKQLQSELHTASRSSERILKRIQDRPGVDMRVLRRKSGDEAVYMLDLRVADLRKKLNKARFDTSAFKERLQRLTRDCDKAIRINADMDKADEILEQSSEGQRLRFLENEIHKTNLKLMEAETIKKKYITILDMLKKERLTFGNQLEHQEDTIRKQEEEIAKLKKTHGSAMATRDVARQNQHRKEVALLSECKEREKRLIEFRRTAEERKNYFETMERHMFATKSTVKDTGHESISTSEQHTSSRDGEERSSAMAGMIDGEDAFGAGKMNDVYEEAFSRMKKAAGVSDIEEVVKRFETQEETAKHLQELQARAEKEIRDLGAVKEKLEAEWELVKFMGQEENVEIRDKMEDLEEKLSLEQQRKSEAEEKLQARSKLLVGIREGLDHLVDTLFSNEVPAAQPHSRNSIEMLGVAQERLNKLMSRLSGLDLFSVKLEMDEEGFIPHGLDLGKPGFSLDDEKDAKKEDVESGPEEEEVPTRSFLKRQANLIVDAKSRSKRGNRKR